MKPEASPLVRRSDPDTSHAAAKVIRPRLSALQRHVLDVFERRGPMSARKAEQLQEFADYGFSTVRKRISELARSGHLVSVGKDESGIVPATVYAVRQP